MILLYKGKSAISKAIRWRTWGDYSHAAWWMRDGSVVEAWHKGGVTHNESPATIHTPGTEIDVFDFKNTALLNEDAAEKFLLEQVGKKYDFRPVLSGFLLRLDRDNPLKWFCSELDFRAAQTGGLNLLDRITAAKVPPQLLSYSTELVRVGTITTIDKHDFNFQALETLPSGGVAS